MEFAASTSHYRNELFLWIKDLRDVYACQVVLLMARVPAKSGIDWLLTLFAKSVTKVNAYREDQSLEETTQAGSEASAEREDAVMAERSDDTMKHREDHEVDLPEYSDMQISGSGRLLENKELEGTDLSERVGVGELEIKN